MLLFLLLLVVVMAARWLRAKINDSPGKYSGALWPYVMIRQERAVVHCDQM